ncbi:MAG: hypothetical protein NZ518_00300 [Dehalococcoidia bacterium]|nr:hypothetical protein [Dehalococcoidia bacterium]
MTTESFRAPVVFFVVNRPDRAANIFARVAEARSRRLWVVADGPLADCPGEGWATWRRVSRHYDASIRDWPAIKPRFAAMVPDPRVRRFGTFYNAIHAGMIDLWSPQR